MAPGVFLGEISGKCLIYYFVQVHAGVLCLVVLIFVISLRGLLRKMIVFYYWCQSLWVLFLWRFIKKGSFMDSHEMNRALFMVLSYG